MADPKLRFDEREDGKTVFEVVGGNGEVQARSEVYDSKSNAQRGANDLASSVVRLLAEGEIRLPHDDALDGPPPE